MEPVTRCQMFGFERARNVLNAGSTRGWGYPEETKAHVPSVVMLLAVVIGFAMPTSMAPEIGSIGPSGPPTERTAVTSASTGRGLSARHFHRRLTIDSMRPFSGSVSAAVGGSSLRLV